MKDDICLDCILKSQNTRSVPLWQKKEGQDSLLPKIIRDDIYNPKKSELKKEHPKLTTNKTKLKLETDKPDTWIFYWAANSSEDPTDIVTEKRAYNTYTNHGLVKTDKEGNAELVLNCPQPYKIGNVTYPRHVHYTFLLENIWSEQIHSTVVMCIIDYKQMEKIVDDKSHYILNALDKDTFHIPNSLNLYYDELEDMSKKERKKHLKDFFLKHTKKYPKLVEIPRKQLPIVVYCANSKCDASHKLTRYLIDAGYVNVIEYTGGIKDWKSHQKKHLEHGDKKYEIHEDDDVTEEGEFEIIGKWDKDKEDIIFQEIKEEKIEDKDGDDISQFANYKVEVKVNKQGGGDGEEKEEDEDEEEKEEEKEEEDEEEDKEEEEEEDEEEEEEEDEEEEEEEEEEEDEPIIEDDEEIEEMEEQQGGGEKLEPPRILIDYSKYGIIFI